MHSNDDKYPARPGLEPGISRLQAPVDTNEPYGPAGNFRSKTPSFRKLGHFSENDAK